MVTDNSPCPGTPGEEGQGVPSSINRKTLTAVFRENRAEVFQVYGFFEKLDASVAKRDVTTVAVNVADPFFADTNPFDRLFKRDVIRLHPRNRISSLDRKSVV